MDDGYGFAFANAAAGRSCPPLSGSLWHCGGAVGKVAPMMGGADNTKSSGPVELPPFDRRFLDGASPFAVIGGGEVGGKARGLLSAAKLLAERFPSGGVGELTVDIPRFAVIATEEFERFVADPAVAEAIAEEGPDQRIAHAFQRADLPARLVGDLRAIAEGVHTPLAVRSSSALEDAMFRPFAGVYATKMLPNNQANPDERFRRLVEAVKLVWASTCFAEARAYRRALGADTAPERMAVIIQDVVGRQAGDRFYPVVSGVARSYNFYPSGRARPEDGVLELALGLGKAIVDGNWSWAVCPAYPKAPPPFNNVRDMLAGTQTGFYAIHMGPSLRPDPLREDEFTVRAELSDAEYDGALRFVASTYDAASDRVVPGTGREGPRVLDFAPLLVLGQIPLVEAVRGLLATGEDLCGGPVEIELAVDIDRLGRDPARLGLLQVRPMVVTTEVVDVSAEDLDAPGVLVASDRALGNASVDAISDVVFIDRTVFEPRHTALVAAELQQVNVRLAAEGRPYVLIGFGRFGTSDPWRGIPVVWSQIAGARVIVEAPFEGMPADPSQGSHFFHNLTSFAACYLAAGTAARPGAVDWERLERLPGIGRQRFVRHVRSAEPLAIRVDGRTRRGLVALGKARR
jgi:hypothetical protein